METLPVEIITHIMKYLSFDDRRAMARVNKSFYYSSCHPMFSRKELLTYKSLKVDLKSYNNFKNMLKNSRRKKLCLKFVDLTFIDDLTIFTDFGSHIISLHFDNLKLLNDSFLDAITQYCINLEKLIFVEFGDFFLTDKDRAPILKLCSISLVNVQITDREFNQILKLAPNLNDLSIINSNMISSFLVLHRFYPHDIDGDNNNDHLFNKYNSNDIFSDKNIIHHLNNSVRLKSLKLNECSNIVCKIQPLRHQFKSLSLNFFKILTNDSFEFINFHALSHYVSLERLEVHYLPIENLPKISMLNNIKHLIISYTTLSTMYNQAELLGFLRLFLMSLKYFKYIKTLSFNRANENNHFTFPTLPLQDSTFNSLTSLDCSLDKNCKPLVMGKNLISLRIRNGETLNEIHLKYLFLKLTKLKYLHIDNCNNLNDDMLNSLPIYNLKELITLKIMDSKITFHCLRNLKFPRLKVLMFNNVSFESTATQRDLIEFENSLLILSTNIPTLTRLELCMNTSSLKLIESSNLLTYFRINIKKLIDMNFKRIKTFKLWDWY